MLSLLKQTCVLLSCVRFDQRKVCKGNFYTKKTAALETILLVKWLHLICNNVHSLQVFNANDGRDDIVKHSLVGIVRASFIRFLPTEFSTGKALRVEVYGVLTTAGKLCKDSCLMSVPVLYTHSLISIFINQRNHKSVFQRSLFA